jgi:hypothetical protein
MRLILTLAVYAGALVVVAAVTFVVVLFVAGPHAGLLPEWAEAAVLILGWLTVLVAPVLAARKVWRHFSRPG